MQGVDNAVAFEWRLSCQERIENGAQPVDVGRRRDRAATAQRLLRGHVGGRSHDRAGLGQLDALVKPLGQAEVRDVRLALLVQQDVGRLEVAVQDSPLVGVLDRFGDVGQQGRDGPRVVLVGVQPGAQAAAGNQLHAEILLTLVFAYLVDGDDAGVVKLSHGLGFVLEAAKVDIVGEDAGPDHLQRHQPVEGDLAGLVHHPHAAAAQLLVDLVVAEIAHPGAAGQPIASSPAVCIDRRVEGRVGGTRNSDPGRLAGQGRGGSRGGGGVER